MGFFGDAFSGFNNWLNTDNNKYLLGTILGAEAGTDIGKTGMLLNQGRIADIANQEQQKRDNEFRQQIISLLSGGSGTGGGATLPYGPVRRPTNTLPDMTVKGSHPFSLTPTGQDGGDSFTVKTKPDGSVEHTTKSSYGNPQPGGGVNLSDLFQTRGF